MKTPGIEVKNNGKEETRRAWLAPDMVTRQKSKFFLHDIAIFVLFSMVIRYKWS